MCDQIEDIYERLWNRMEKADALPLSDLKLRTVWDHGSHWIYVEFEGHDRHPIAQWRVMRSPGLLIIEHAWVADEHRGKGLGKFLNVFRVEAFKEMREHGSFDPQTGGEAPCEDIEMICYCSPSNSKQHHILLANGWERVSEKLWRVK